MSTISATLLGLLFGLGSALLPFLNAETYAIASVAASPWTIALVVTALACGQTVGKLLLFELARRGSAGLKAPARLRALTSGRWSGRIQGALSERRTALPLVLMSAGLGLPPLALVSVAAGAADQKRGDFVVACLVGRAARFAALAGPVAFAVSRS